MAPKFKLGKKEVRRDARTLRFSKYSAGLSAPPAQSEWQGAVPSYPMDGNDSVGDCTIAGAAHLVETWSYNEKPPTSIDFSTQDCLNDYYALTGGPDTGLDLLTVLKQWQGNGLAYDGGKSDVIDAYVQLSEGSQYEAQQAVSLFGGVYIGLQLPDFIVNAADPLTVSWTVPPGGPTGNAAPNPSNGHCVCIVGYDAQSFFIVTWGQVIRMGYDFYAAYSDEAYAILAKDWIGSGQAPSGFDLAQLQADLTAVENETPPPNPGSSPSIWNEIAAAFQAFIKAIESLF